MQLLLSAVTQDQEQIFCVNQSVLFLFLVLFNYGRPMEQGRPLYFCPVVSSSFYLSIFFPRLTSAIADWMSAIQKIQDAKSRQKLPSGHHRTTLSGYIFASKASIDNQKKTC